MRGASAQTTGEISGIEPKHTTIKTEVAVGREGTSRIQPQHTPLDIRVAGVAVGTRKHGGAVTCLHEVHHAAECDVIDDVGSDHQRSLGIPVVNDEIRAGAVAVKQTAGKHAANDGVAMIAGIRGLQNGSPVDGQRIGDGDHTGIH